MMMPLLQTKERRQCQDPHSAEALGDRRRRRGKVWAARLQNEVPQAFPVCSGPWAPTCLHHPKGGGSWRGVTEPRPVIPSQCFVPSSISRCLSIPQSRALAGGWGEEEGEHRKEMGTGHPVGRMTQEWVLCQGTEHRWLGENQGAEWLRGSL